jgi:hypothetical protein
MAFNEEFIRLFKLSMLGKENEWMSEGAPAQVAPHA